MPRDDGFPEIGPELHEYTRKQHLDSMKAKERALVPPPAPGRYADMDEEEHHAADAVSASALKRLVPPNGDPAICDRERRLETVESPSLTQGKAIHCAALEPDRFDTTYVVLPSTGKGVKAYREEVEQAGYIGITQSQMDVARCARDSLYAHPLASKLLGGLQREDVEQSFFFDASVAVGDGANERIVPLVGKMRADLCRESIGAWIDLKSSNVIEPNAWSRASYTYGYDVVKAWYQLGVERCGVAGLIQAQIEDYFFLVVENKLPCRVEVYQMDEATSELGRQRMHAAWKTWARCVLNGSWATNRPTRVRPYHHPDWAFKEWGEYLDHAEDEEVQP